MNKDILAYKIAIALLTQGLLSKNENIDISEIPDILRDVASYYEEENKLYE